MLIGKGTNNALRGYMKKFLLALVLIGFILLAVAIGITFTNPLLRRTPGRCRKSHVINGAPGAGTNYQIKIKVHYGSGIDSGEDVYLNHNSRIDFGDVRFMDDNGVTELDYWIQEKVNGYYAIFWVEVRDDLSYQSQVIYIYYGNNDATTTSSITDTFIIAMDTEGTAIGDTPPGWTDGSTRTSSATVQSDQSKYGTSSLKLVHAGWDQYGIIYKNGFSLPNTFAIEFAVRVSMSAQAIGEYDQVFEARSLSYTEAWLYHPCTYRGMYFWNRDSWRLMDSSVDTWYEVSIICDDGNDQVEAIYVDGVERLSGSKVFENAVRITSFLWRTTTSDTAGNMWLDGFRVRKYVEPEPTHGAWGVEEPVE